MEGINPWIREKHNPIIVVVPGSWRESATANPDLLFFRDYYFLYYRGQQGGHDRIGVMTVFKLRFDGKTWIEYPGNPIIDVGPPGSFDCQHVLDPASVVVNKTIYLYYSAIGAGPDSIGLATSRNGFTFEKYDRPVLVGRAPEVVYRDGLFYLFYVDDNDVGGYKINLAVSSNGYDFSIYPENPILTPGPPGSWDSQTVTTPRIFFENGLYYMVYAGDDSSKDSPKGFGLATSRDLYHWTKYPGNPIFLPSGGNNWDGSFIWFGTVHKVRDTYYMWYEGRGPEGPSQVGLATMKADYFYVKP